MEFDPRDQDIIRLLTKLKGVKAEYPENMFMARRQSFLNRLAEIELGADGGAQIRNAGKTTKPPHAPPITGTLLEAALLVVIAVEASMMAYFYREKLADFFQTFTTASRTEEVAPPPVIPTSPEMQSVVPSTTIPVDPAGVTGTPTPTSIPDMLVNNNSSTPEANSLNSTPDPNGNNGHHYGQTPKPQRTKENNSNNGKPPKDKPTKDKPKPTKAK